MKGTPTFLQKARAAWGEPLPAWVRELALECDKAGIRGTARKINERRGPQAQKSLSPASISIALRRARKECSYVYVQMIVEQCLALELLPCPVLGLLPRAECREEQNRGFVASNPLRARLLSACPKCPYREGK